MQPVLHDTIQGLLAVWTIYIQKENYEHWVFSFPDELGSENVKR